MKTLVLAIGLAVGLSGILEAAPPVPNGTTYVRKTNQGYRYYNHGRYLGSAKKNSFGSYNLYNRRGHKAYEGRNLPSGNQFYYRTRR